MSTRPPRSGSGARCAARPRTSSRASDLIHIERNLGRTRIEQLIAEQVGNMHRDCLKRGLSVGSIHHIRRTLSAAMSTAVNRGYVMRNPVPSCGMPALRLKLPDRLGLIWSDLDLDEGWVSISHPLPPMPVEHGCTVPCGLMPHAVRSGEAAAYAAPR